MFYEKEIEVDNIEGGGRGAERKAIYEPVIDIQKIDI